MIDRESRQRRRVDRLVWGILYFCLAVSAALVFLGVYALADLVL